MSHTRTIVAESAGAVNRAEPSVREERRYDLVVRVTHWVNTLSVLFLLWSGVHIFLDFPALYWGDVGFHGLDAWFETSQVGLSWDRANELGNRKWGRNYHFLFAWLFVLNGVVYVAWSFARGRFRAEMAPRRDEISRENLRRQIEQHLRLRRGPDESGRYNVLQKLSYLIAIFVLAPMLLLSGLAQMPAFSAIAPGLIDLFGGRQSARTVHVLLTLGLCLFVALHILQVLASGPMAGIYSMVTGRRVTRDARSGDRRQERNP